VLRCEDVKPDSCWVAPSGEEARVFPPGPCQVNSSNGKSREGDMQEPSGKTISSDPRTKPKQTFREKLLEYPRARNALEILQVDGMNMDVTVAFLQVIAWCRSESFDSTLLPRPEDLKAAEARAQRLGHQIAIFNSNLFLDPKRSFLMKVPEQYGRVFEWLPGALGAYSAYLGVQASLMGEIGKTKPKASKTLIILMLEHVKQATGTAHFGLIALLLTAAYTVCGCRDKPTERALMMLLKRSTSGRLAKALGKALTKALPPSYVHVTEKKGPFGRFSRLGK